MSTKTGNRAGEQGLDSLPLTNLSSYIFRNPFIRRLAHKAQSLSDTLVRIDIQKWCLTQLHCQGLLERAIEYWFASCIDEVSEEYGVLVSKRGFSMAIEISTNSDRGNYNQRYQASGDFVMLDSGDDVLCT